MTKRKIATVDFIFSGDEYDLSAITEDWVRSVLKEKKMLVEGEGPAVIIHKIRTEDEE